MSGSPFGARDLVLLPLLTILLVVVLAVAVWLLQTLFAYSAAWPLLVIG